MTTRNLSVKKKQSARKSTRTSAHSGKAAVTKAAVDAASQPINVWLDDPLSGGPLVRRPAPTPGPEQRPLALRLDAGGPAPAPDLYLPGTKDFACWSVQEALHRGLAFWAPLLPQGTRWPGAEPLDVRIDAGQEANAFYDRASLSFFHFPDGQGGTAFIGESPDIVVHELGHAVLDALRPQLWNAMSYEAAAFHEAFGDVSTLLVALQEPQMATRVIQETGGQLHLSSPASRVGEQLGALIRRGRPWAVEPDCLRNIANGFFYQPPHLLPPNAPASQLSSEPHSYSRVFTGAFLEALSFMAAGAGTLTPASLAALGETAARLLVRAVSTAPVRPDYFSQVAAHMLMADAVITGGTHQSALSTAFTRRGLLAFRFAAAGVQTAGAPRATCPSAVVWSGPPHDSALPVVTPHSAELPVYAANGSEWGLSTAALRFEVPDEPSTHAAAPTTLRGVFQPLGGPVADAEHFLEYLFRRGRVDLATPRGAAAAAGTSGGLLPRAAWTTHTLEPSSGDAVQITRRCFDCGLHVWD